MTLGELFFTAAPAVGYVAGVWLSIQKGRLSQTLPENRR